MKLVVLDTTYKPAKNLSLNDVFGEFKDSELVSRGMVVAQGWPGEASGPEYEAWTKRVQVSSFCPVWKDKLPWKSVTVICNEDQAEEVKYWLEYVHGGGSVNRMKNIENGKIAIRSDYQCW